MITNERIEESLKNANIWYHTNTYFFGTISDLKIDGAAITGNKKVSAKYLINLTENDIIIIPIVYSGFKEELFTEEKINICSGDIEKVVVVPQNGYYYRLEVTKRDGEVIKILVNLLTDELQRKNIIKFVENFRNEGAESLFREDFRPNFTNYTNVKQPQAPFIKYIGVSILIYVFITFLFTALVLVGYKDIVKFTPFLSLSFVIMWIFVFIGIISSALRTSRMRNTNINHQNNPNRPSFNQMTQEQREEVREKRNEDIITSTGPISSDDENYGGIKKM